MSSPITVIAELEAKPECAAEYRAALAPLVNASRQEPGCLRYRLHQSLESPCGWMIHEEWKSEAALSAHQQRPHFLAFVASTRGWFASTSVCRYQLA
ncbi:MAG: putative quinol monooxygenase [Aeromonas molluscorum]